MKKLIMMTLMLAFFGLSTNAQWVSKAAGYSGTPQQGINQMIAVNQNVAWGIAYERNNSEVNPSVQFTRTIDGGKHWIPGSILQFPNYFLIGISPLSGTTAFAIVNRDPDYVGKVLKTTDGGITWSALAPLPVPVFCMNIQFFNLMDGVIIGDTSLVDTQRPAVFTTHNGGNTWTQVTGTNFPPQNDPTEDFYPWSMSNIGNTIWTVSTTARIWKSTDKGEHWVANNTSETEAIVSNIKMRDALHGLWGINDELYRTSDGGITWSEVNITGTFFTFGLSYVPGTAATWVSSGGDTSDISVDFFTGALHGLGSSYSVDDGNTWITIDTAVDHLAIAMVSPFKGYCGGFNTSTSDGVFNYEGPALGYACGNNHTYMCHHGNTICVANNKILKHIAHGDYLGACIPNYRIEENSETTTDKNKSDFIISPNPVSNSTTISFSLEQSEKVSLKIFDLNGKLVATLADKIFDEGEHQIEFTSEKINAGIYFLKMQAEEFLKTEKLIVTK